MTGFVVGIDLSMTSTGLAWVDELGGAATWTVQSKGKRADDLATRSRRLVYLAAAVVGSMPGRTRFDLTVDLVVLEAPSYGSTGASSWDRAGLWWLVVTKLHRLDVPIALCAPATRAKYATGSGRADKAAVAVAAAHLFPSVEISNSDEADALILAHIGAAHAGYPVGALTRHREALKSVHFPAESDGMDTTDFLHTGVAV